MRIWEKTTEFGVVYIVRDDPDREWVPSNPYWVGIDTELHSGHPVVRAAMDVVKILNSGMYSGIDGVEFCKEILG